MIMIAMNPRSRLPCTLLFLCLTGCAARDQVKPPDQDPPSAPATEAIPAAAPLVWRMETGRAASTAEPMVQVLEQRLAALSGIAEISSRIRVSDVTICVTPAADAPADLAGRIQATLDGTDYAFDRVRD